MQRGRMNPRTLCRPLLQVGMLVRIAPAIRYTCCNKTDSCVVGFRPKRLVTNAVIVRKRYNVWVGVQGAMCGCFEIHPCTRNTQSCMNQRRLKCLGSKLF